MGAVDRCHAIALARVDPRALVTQRVVRCEHGATRRELAGLGVLDDHVQSFQDLGRRRRAAGHDDIHVDDLVERAHTVLEFRELQLVAVHSGDGTRPDVVRIVR